MNDEKTIRASFACQKMMATLGATMIRVAEGEINLLLPFRESLTQQHGYRHAGVVGLFWTARAATRHSRRCPPERERLCGKLLV